MVLLFIFTLNKPSTAACLHSNKAMINKDFKWESSKTADGFFNEVMFGREDSNKLKHFSRSYSLNKLDSLSYWKGYGD